VRRRRAEIHAHDTSNWERAEISARLGKIFRIRFELYQRKFLVKFLNNLLSQVTPFLFYTVAATSSSWVSWTSVRWSRSSRRTRICRRR